METPVIVALIGGWSTIAAALFDVRRRVNGVLDKKLELVKAEIRDSKVEIVGIKADVRELKQDIRCLSDRIPSKEVKEQ